MWGRSAQPWGVTYDLCSRRRKLPHIAVCAGTLEVLLSTYGALDIIQTSTFTFTFYGRWRGQKHVVAITYMCKACCINKEVIMQNDEWRNSRIIWSVICSLILFVHCGLLYYCLTSLYIVICCTITITITTIDLVRRLQIERRRITMSRTIKTNRNGSILKMITWMKIYPICVLWSAVLLSDLFVCVCKIGVE